MNTYPYYIVAYFDSGLLKKLFHGKKFKTYFSALTAMSNISTSTYDNRLKDFLNNNQVVILEYTAEYQGKIIVINNYGKIIPINNAVKNIE